MEYLDNSKFLARTLNFETDIKFNFIYIEINSA